MKIRSSLWLKQREPANDLSQTQIFGKAIIGLSRKAYAKAVR